MPESFWSSPLSSPAPLLRASDFRPGWPRQPVALTPLGERVLAGRENWRDHATAERWVGGVRLGPREPHWALDDALRPVWRA